MACLVSCVASIDYSETGERFEACRSECEHRLSSMDVSVPCLMLNQDAMIQYTDALERGEEVGYAHTARFGGCGCATTVMSLDGRLTDMEIVYSNSKDASAFFGDAIDHVQLDLPIESCLENAVVPIVFFGLGSEPSEVFKRRNQSIFPMRQVIFDYGLEETSGIVLEGEIGWSSLNTKFGVLYVGEGRYLAEAELDSNCLPLDTATDISIDGRKEIGSEVSAEQIKIEECWLRRLYPISAEQEMALKRLSIGKNLP
jgi:hypothetical protein